MNAQVHPETGSHETPSHLAGLVDQARGMMAEDRRALLQEIATRFVASPTHSPEKHATFIALMTGLAATLDETDRTQLGTLLEGREDVPDSLRALCAPAPEMHIEPIEDRLAHIEDEPKPAPLPSEQDLLCLLRSGALRDFLAAFAAATHRSTEDAEAALSDESGRSLAELCREEGFQRATYSAIVLLSDPLHLRAPERNLALLSLYDDAHLDSRAA
jgi:hypothetical protein